MEIKRNISYQHAGLCLDDWSGQQSKKANCCQCLIDLSVHRTSFRSSFGLRLKLTEGPNQLGDGWLRNQLLHTLPRIDPAEATGGLGPASVKTHRVSRFSHSASRATTNRFFRLPSEFGR